MPRQVSRWHEVIVAPPTILRESAHVLVGKGYVEKNPDTVKKFTDAIARRVMYIRQPNKDCTTKAIKEPSAVTDTRGSAR